MIDKSTAPGTTAWHLRNVSDFINRVCYFEDYQEGLDWLIRECKIGKREKETHWDCPGYFWVEFANSDSSGPKLCAPPDSLFPSRELALDQVSRILKGNKKYFERELEKVCEAQRVILSMMGEGVQQ